MPITVLHHCKTKNCPDLQILHDAINRHMVEYAYLVCRTKEAEEALKELKEIVESFDDEVLLSNVSSKLKKVIEKLEVKPQEYYLPRSEQKK